MRLALALKKSGIAAAALLSGWSAHAELGDGFPLGALRVLPSAGLSLVHDSNVALTSNTEIDSFLMIFSPAVRVQGGTDRNHYALTAQSEIARYQSSSIDNYADYGLSAEWQYNPLTRHALGFDGSWERGHDSRGTAAREGDLALLPLDPDSYDRYGIGAKYRFGAPGARGRLEFNVHRDQIDYRNNRLFTVFRDRKDLSLGGSLYWRIAPKTSAVVSVDRVTAKYQVATLDSTEHHLLVGLDFDATARTSGGLLFGKSWKRFDDPTRPDFSGTSWRANLKYRLRSYSTLELSTSRDTDETNGFGDFILRRDVTLAWSHQWNSKLGSQVDVGQARDEHRPSARNDDTFFYGFSGQYHFRPWLSLGAGFRDYNRDSDIPALNYRRQQWLLSLEASL